MRALSLPLILLLAMHWMPSAFAADTVQTQVAAIGAAALGITVGVMLRCRPLGCGSKL
jgi:hypothetical protein